ncbi:hypothetical protein ACS0TY_007549 [Phlomoides rotata]
MEVLLFKVQIYYSTLRIALIFLLSIGYSAHASSNTGYVDNYIAKSYFNRYDSLVDQEFDYFVANEIPLGLFKVLKDKYHVLPTLSGLHRNVAGEGSHRHLSSSIRFKLPHELKPELIAHSCEVIIIERLPSGVFADPFELQHLVQRDVFTDVAVFGDKNLELPSFRSNRTVVEIHMSIASKMFSSHEDDLVVNLGVPLHARYPALGLGFSRVQFRQPDLFMCCNIEENRSCVSMAIVDTEASSDVWEIPCGIKEHARIVSVVTFAFAVITALLLVSASATY